MALGALQNKGIPRYTGQGNLTNHILKVLWPGRLVSTSTRAGATLLGAMTRVPASQDLFDARLATIREREAPLAARVRPHALDRFVGQSAIVGPGTLLRRAIEDGKVGSLILFGPPGVGKTTLAEIIARSLNASVAWVSAVTAGVSDLRRIIEEARERRKLHEQRTVLVVDEIHRFTSAQQDVLLPHVEEGIVTLIGVTTENPYFEVVKALVSRAQVLQLVPLSEDEVGAIVDRALADTERGLGAQRLALDPAARAHLARRSGGDARIALNALELASAAKRDGETVTLADVEEALQRRALQYDQGGDAHYDTISAFIKSLRGSDPDAALVWLHTMLVAGEDPEFIARRMMIFASEDIGTADPQALLIATSAAATLEWVGLPEAEYALSHAALTLATAPKSDAVKRAMGAVKQDLKTVGRIAVPPHLKNAPIPEMRRHPSTGSGQAAPSVGYKDPHQGPEHVVEQQYLPDALQDRRYYEPTEQGREAELRKRVEHIRNIRCPPASSSSLTRAAEE